MNLVFYYTPMTSATRVHWALEELGVPYEKVKVDLAGGEQLKPEFLKLNPNGKVPLLVVDGTPLFESLAIMLFLGETFGVDKGLFPAPGRDRLEAFKWMSWGSVTLGDSLHRFVRNTSDRFPAEERNSKAAEAARKDLANNLAVLDAALSGKEFLIGNSFSVADAAVATMPAFMARIGIDLGPFKNISAWVARTTSRPALARAMTA